MEIPLEISQYEFWNMWAGLKYVCVQCLQLESTGYPSNANNFDAGSAWVV